MFCVILKAKITPVNGHHSQHLTVKIACAILFWCASVWKIARLTKAFFLSQTGDEHMHFYFEIIRRDREGLQIMSNRDQDQNPNQNPNRSGNMNQGDRQQGKKS